MQSVLIKTLALLSSVSAFQPSQLHSSTDNPLPQYFNSAGRIERVWAEAGRHAELALPISSEDKVNMILWFKDNAGIPFYSVDARGGDLSNASHAAITDDLGARSYFVTGQIPLLRVTRVSAKDQGLFRARVDYLDSPTRNYRLNLSLVVPPTEIQILDSNGSELKGEAGPYLEGHDIFLTCIVTGGEPRPKVSWLLNDEEVGMVSESTNTGIVTNRLHLVGVSRSLHLARLSCSALSTPNSTPTLLPLTLKLYLKPRTVKIVRKGEGLAAGKSKQLLCESEGSTPPANITWLIEGQMIRQAATMVGTTKNKTESVLSLRPSADEDGKELSCTARNPMFPGVQLTDSIRLRITYAPIAFVRLDDDMRSKYPLKEGDNVTLVCDIKANPAPDYILWYHGSQLISKNETGQRLLLPSVNASSGGQYSCFVRNSQGATTSVPYNLHVNYAPKCAKEWEYRETGALSGQEIVAECRVEASPAKDLRFSWTLTKLREVIPLPPSQIRSEGTVSYVTFKPTSPSDVGILSCWASNTVGRQISPCVLQLTPARAPERPHGCRVVNRSGDGLEVRCEAGSDGGKIQHFVAEVRTWPTQTPGALSDQAPPLLTLLSPYPTFRMTGLAPDTAYQLTLYAKNPVGLSQPPVILPAQTLATNPLEIIPPSGAGLADEGIKYIWWWMGGVIAVVVCSVMVLLIVLWTMKRPDAPSDVPLNNMPRPPVPQPFD